MTPDLSRDKFIELARSYAVVPISMEVLGDRETAVSVFEKLIGDDTGFLLESVEGGERWARWSFVGGRPEFTLVAKDGVTEAIGGHRNIPDGNPLEVLEQVVGEISVPSAAELGYPDDHPPLHSGAVGYLAYDAVRHVEHLPNRPADDRGLPEMVWQFFGLLAAVDRFRETVHLIKNVFSGGDPGAAYDRAVAELDEAAALLTSPSSYAPRSRPDFDSQPVARSNMSQADFETAVLKAKEHIRIGDAFQIVPSIRFEVDLHHDPFLVYRSLRLVNPSPFMFFVRHDEVSIVGSSPELMARARDGIATSRPIAGTKSRGATVAEDEQLEKELLGDPKERAEHVMLIDLARNDLGRVCEFGSVNVDDLMVIERYSHVMHIVSGVSGRLRKDVGPVDVLRATFPHGTVSGAPKVRAMEIIDDLEPTARGPYAGAVGYVDFSGNLDTAIALRTLVAANGKAWVQAGAGIVADSDPETEYRECLSKAAAVLAAVEAANRV
ncbi:MAG: anthranilate synthase component I [bacterium]|nr:anthranilate synthase component I [bacterium]